MSMNFGVRRVSFVMTTVCCLSFFVSCTKTDFAVKPQPDAEKFAAKVAVDWMEQTRQVITTEGKNPPQASRIYAYAALAVYQSALPGMKGYKTLEHQIKGLNNLPIAETFDQLDYIVAINEAMYQLSTKVYGALQQSSFKKIEQLHNQYFDDKVKSVSGTIIQNSVSFGKMVAIAILNRANNDHFSETRTMQYTSPNWLNNEAYWAPTDASNLSPLEPYWGKVQCFGMLTVNECEVPASVTFSASTASDFYNEAFEVFTTSQNLTSEQKNIALWWADGGGTATPPGHWVAIENKLVESKNLSLAKAAEMYVLVNVAMADAFISCWDAKYKFNLVRPQTFINKHISPAGDWKPFIPTPPFPEYPSGHSVASGVAASVLTSLFGNVSFTDDTNVSLGLSPRKFTSFKEAADEAAISRLYGGIHYRDACINGLKQGELVAKSIQKNIRIK